MSKKAIIVGSGGQDGRIMFDYLAKKEYGIIGIDRDAVNTRNTSWNKKIDISNRKEVFELLKKTKPDEVYYLAAFHHSSEDKSIDTLELFERSYAVHVHGLIYFLEGIQKFSPRTKIFYAASSLIFGASKTETQNENTPFNPDNIYGITKLDGLMMCRFYRNNYNVFASVGILYNHESVYRPEKFISMKIIQGAVNIKRGTQKDITVGDLSAEVDWGYASDYIEAMHSMLQQNKPDEYIIATGKKHSVRDFVKIAFKHVGLDWKKYVKENKQVLTRKRKPIVGNASKLQKATGWRPKTEFKDMIKLIIDQKIRLNK